MCKDATEDAVPVSLILARATAMRSRWLANDASRLVAQALEGLAHDATCEGGECEDSTVSHLQAWRERYGER